MGGPLSVIFLDIFMTKLEENVVKPLKPKFYKCFVDNVISKRVKNKPDDLLTKLNSYHKKINFTVEENPSKFLDTKLTFQDGIYKTSVYQKPTKLPPHWSSKTPKRYKRNAINGNLYRAKQISSDMPSEVEIIKTKYQKAGYPPKFINSVIAQFNDREKERKEQDEMIIPEMLFEERKPLLLIQLPYCQKNEEASKLFIKKLNNFTNNNYDVRIQWKTKKVKELFKLKDKNQYPACVIYKGVCSCGISYIGETKRNVIIRWNEHNDIRKNSEPAKHLLENFGHSFNWSVICNAPNNIRERKNLEASFIALMRPQLNEQIESKLLL